MKKGREGRQLRAQARLQKASEDHLARILANAQDHITRMNAMCFPRSRKLEIVRDYYPEVIHLVKI